MDLQKKKFFAPPLEFKGACSTRIRFENMYFSIPNERFTRKSWRKS